MMNGNGRNYSRVEILFFLVFLTLIYFAVFHRLGRLPISLWDESLFSLRALHMHLTGEYMSDFNLFNGLPNHRNTKLPFTIFFQVLSLKVFGVNEFAIRLPNALIFTGTAIYMLGHFKSRFGSVWSGFIFGLVAITTLGFMRTHMLSTGDQDAPFACYILLATLAFVTYSESRKTLPLVGFVFFSLAAVLTKNLLAGLLAPGIIVYLFISRQYLLVFRDLKFWLACLIIIGVYIGVIYYYELRFPGFFDRMWGYELVGRYNETIEDHYDSPFYYLKLITLDGFSPYSFLLPIVIFGVLRTKADRKLKNSMISTACVIFSFVMILSFSKTQAPWYIAPVYLLGPYMIALGSLPVLQYLGGLTRRSRLVVVGIIFMLWFIFFVGVVSNNLKRVPDLDEEKYGLFMGRLALEIPEMKIYTLVDNGFGSSSKFYTEMYNLKGEGYNIGYQRDIIYNRNQIIMTCLDAVSTDTYAQYKIEELKTWDKCKLLKVISAK